VDHPWEVVSYQSGTCIVTNNAPNTPHFGLGAARDGDEHRLGEALAKFLNDDQGSETSPVKDFQRVNEEKLVSANGRTFVEARGPFYDEDPPACNWKTCMKASSLDARARLIDTVHLRPTLVVG